MNSLVTWVNPMVPPMPFGSSNLLTPSAHLFTSLYSPFTFRGLPADHRDQIADFLIDLGGKSHSLRHFLPHQFAEAAAQPGRCAADGAFAHVQLAAQFGVGQRVCWFGAGAENFQALIKPGLAC